MHLARAPESVHPRNDLARVLLLLIAVKAALLLVDPTLRFFLGDSATYIHYARIGMSPPDRSFTYALLIRFFALPAESLYPLLLLQTAFGIATALLAFRMLTAAFALEPRAAAAIALAVALGPEQLFFERMVMAESAGLICFAAMLTFGFAYVRAGRWPWLIGVAVAGIAAVSFRVSLLPAVLGFSVLSPLAYWVFAHAPRRRMLGLAGGLAIAVLATATLHWAYKHTWLLHEGTKHDYIAHGGYFRLGLVAPLVEPQDLAGLGLPDNFLATVGPPLKEPSARESQLWLPDGLRVRLRDQLGDYEGNRAARKIAARAIRREPLGLVRLGVSTLRDYFNPQVARVRMSDDLGERRLPAEFAAGLDEWFHYGNADTIPKSSTPVFAYFRASTAWLTACLFGLPPLSLIMLACTWRSQRRAAALLLCATSLGVFFGHALFSHIVSYRYLHAFPLLMGLNAGALAAALMARRANADDSGIAASIDPEPR